MLHIWGLETHPLLWNEIYNLNLLAEWCIMFNVYCMVCLWWFSWSFLFPLMELLLDEVWLPSLLDVWAGISEAKICWFFDIVLNHWSISKVGRQNILRSIIYFLYLKHLFLHSLSQMISQFIILRNLGSSVGGNLLEVLILRDCMHLKEAIWSLPFSLSLPLLPPP